MSFKFIADTFSVARDSDHFIQLKTLKSPRTDDQVWLSTEIVGDSKYARATSQSIIDTMEDVFFDNFELSVYERFEQALKEVNIILKSLKEKRGKSFGQINTIIAVFSNNELHITQSNNAEAYLIRQNKFSMISEGLSSKSEDLFVNIASGELMPDDKLIFSTARLLRLATHSQIVQLFNDGVAEAIEATRDLTMNDEELSLGVVAIHAKLIQKASTKLETVKENKLLIKLKELVASIGDFINKKTNRGDNGVNTKKVLTAIAVVALILIVSVSFLVKSSRNNAIREEYRTKIDALHQDLNIANTKGYANDKESANAILTKVEGEAREILDTNYFRAEALALLDKIQDSRDNINNTDRLKELAPYVDLTTKDTDVKALGIVNMDKNFFVYGYNKLYEIILDQVLEPRVIDDTEIVIAATAMSDQDIIVFLTQSGRIIEFENGQIKFANTDDESWKSGVALGAYGKYLYVLSSEDNQIYKYARLRSKYSSGSGYNSDADLKNAISMTIDGDIYVLKKGGSIVRLFKGKQQQFKIENLTVDLSDATQLYTSAELDNLYILDPVNKRVIITTKSESGISRYYGQVVFEELENIRGMYVEKNENKLHILTDKEIYKIDI